MCGRVASVSLVQQNQVRGQFLRQRDGLGLARIEGRCEQSHDLVLSQSPRLDPAVQESLPDLLKGCRVSHSIKFGLDTDGNPDLAKLPSEKIQPANNCKV